MTHLELYETMDFTKKEFLKEYGATTAIVLRLTNEYYGNGCIAVAHLWFGSVKSSIVFMKKGLYANMLVKTAHKGFPRDQLNEKIFFRGN